MTTVTSEYIRTLTINDLTVASTVDVVNGKFVDVATYQVPARQRIYVGNGRINLGVDDRGTFKMDLDTSAPADIAGVSRIILRDANGVMSRFLREDLSVDYETGVKVGKGGKTGNEKNLYVANRDDYIVIQFDPESSATVSKSDSTIYLPVTVQTLA